MTPATDSSFIRIRGLAKSFMEGERRRIVFDALDLDLEGGRFYAILGASGSGKSTLLNLIGGIDHPDEGSIEIDGREISQLDERARTLFRRESIGYVFQFFNLIPTLSVLENTMLRLELNGERGAAAESRAKAALAKVGLEDRGASFPDRLSGGEQQRVAIAATLAHGAALVLADEPTGNLDGDTGDKVLELLVEGVRSEGRTLLMATHSRRAAARADTILRVEERRVRIDSTDAH